MKIAGKDFILSIEIGGQLVPVCHATDCTIDKVYENVETSGTTSYWKDYIGTYAGYSIQVPGIIAYNEKVNWIELEEIADQRRKFKWQATGYQNGGVVHSGTILITNIRLTSQMRDVMKFEMSAVGCGPMVTDKLPISAEVYLSDFNKERLAGCPNPYPVSVFWYDQNGGPGGFLGVANNVDDVMSLFNDYAENTNYQLTGAQTGCDFNLLASWDTEFIPDVIYTQPVPEMGLWTGTGDQAISPNWDNDEVISPGYA